MVKTLLLFYSIYFSRASSQCSHDHAGPCGVRVHRAHQSVLAQGSGSLVAAVPTQLTTAPWPWFSCCCYYVCTGFSFVARLACSLLFSLGYTRCPDPPASVTSVCNHVYSCDTKDGIWASTPDRASLFSFLSVCMRHAS